MSAARRVVARRTTRRVDGHPLGPDRQGHTARLADPGNGASAALGVRRCQGEQRPVPRARGDDDLSAHERRSDEQGGGCAAVRRAHPAALAALPRAVSSVSSIRGFLPHQGACLRAAAAILLSEHGGQVPSEMEQLLALPGVGRKTANLVRNLGFGLLGICVDTHVHRISNRMGWVSTKSPEQTEQALMESPSPSLLDHDQRAAGALRPVGLHAVAG